MARMKLTFDNFVWINGLYRVKLSLRNCYSLIRVDIIPTDMWGTRAVIQIHEYDLCMMEWVLVLQIGNGGYSFMFEDCDKALEWLNKFLTGDYQIESR